MLRVTISLAPESGEPIQLLLKKFRLLYDEVTVSIRKRSIDARKEPVFTWIVDFAFQSETKEKEIFRTFSKKYHMEKVDPDIPYVFPKAMRQSVERPIVVGFGPAGIFCALMLARCGYRPIVLERGGSVEERVEKVNAFFTSGVLDTECNIQFGEGGAGAFSDGKLNTLVKDKSFRGYYVLEQLVNAGAPEEILWLNKPHIGTDLLRNVIRNIRLEIETLGGSVLFHQKVNRILKENGKVTGVVTEEGKQYSSDTVVLALGHSARDTFRILNEFGLPMEKKPFSVGVRVEHLQEWINQAQYGESSDRFPAADYKLVCHTSNGRTIYSFCMCPGGVVVPAASEVGGVVTNGMSYHARDGKNANSALLCEIFPEDVPGDLFSGMRFQEELEKKAYCLGGGNYVAPAETVGDFMNHTIPAHFGQVVPSYARGVKPTDLRELLPSYITDALEEAFPYFGRKIHGFDHPDAVMTAVESRSTSPVRILRNESYETEIRGIFPIGEGAGFAGGIVSAAIDGIRCAEHIVSK